jgi:hypothetical protein
VLYITDSQRINRLGGFMAHPRRSSTVKSREETYRKKADECERAAARVDNSQTQVSYREMSRRWHEMAERQLAIDEALTGVGTV